MAPACLHGLIHAATAANDTERPVVDRRLRGQEIQGGLDIAWHALHDVLTLRREVRVLSCLAPTEAAEIKCQHVVPGRVQHRGQLIVNPTIGIALVQQENSGPAFFCRIEGALQRESIRGVKADVFVLCNQCCRKEQNNDGCQPQRLHRESPRDPLMNPD